MNNIYKNLYQFTMHMPQMDFTIHQYLLVSEPSILFATGTVQTAKEIIHEIKSILEEKELKYIFVSHFESDECGGLSVFLKEYPDVTVICSNLCARELRGFGYDGKILVCTHDSTLEDKEIALKFFNYPSEVHLQNGLICFEEQSGIFYSGDLMQRFGNGEGKILKSTWIKEIEEISDERVPNRQKLEALKEFLKTISPEFIAVGHGFCLECK